ncbi:SHOCT domain-containing protein [Williamsia soli]|uniref:SHOCT domain-containing protein n=1 Tax=Williamsia soli TaxID=364929 RepID=UPI001A9DAD31|nr:SHOCT domain-containing protein [Williamsia soli]
MGLFGHGSRDTEPSFVRTFVPILAFSLLCGIVGPIFLVAYFVIGDPMVGWMFYAGLGITILDVVIAFFISQFTYRGKRRRFELEQTGRLGVADVLSVEQTNVQVNNQPMMKLKLRIHGDGIAPFDADKRLVVPLMHLSALNARRLAVLVDPYSGQFEIDWQRTPLLAGSAPARFTDTDTGREFDLSGQSDALLEIMNVFKNNNIPFGGTVDLRSNPVARQQVMDIVRRVGGQPAGGPDLRKADYAAPPAPPRSPSQRLAELEAMRGAGNISDAEYQAVRTRILGEL